MRDERYDLTALLNERPGVAPLPRIVWVGRDEYGHVFRTRAWPTERRDDLYAVLDDAVDHPRRRWVDGGSRRARETLAGLDEDERVRNGVELRRRWFAAAAAKRSLREQYPRRRRPAVPTVSPEDSR